MSGVYFLAHRWGSIWKEVCKKYIAQLDDVTRLRDLKQISEVGCPSIEKINDMLTMQPIQQNEKRGACFQLFFKTY